MNDQYYEKRPFSGPNSLDNLSEQINSNLFTAHSLPSENCKAACSSNISTDNVSEQIDNEAACNSEISIDNL